LRFAKDQKRWFRPTVANLAWPSRVREQKSWPYTLCPASRDWIVAPDAGALEGQGLGGHAQNMGMKLAPRNPCRVTPSAGSDRPSGATPRGQLTPSVGTPITGAPTTSGRKNGNARGISSKTRLTFLVLGICQLHRTVDRTPGWPGRQRRDDRALGDFTARPYGRAPAQLRSKSRGLLALCTTTTSWAAKRLPLPPRMFLHGDTLGLPKLKGLGPCCHPRPRRGRQGHEPPRHHRTPLDEKGTRVETILLTPPSPAASWRWPVAA
jgi:hypothetical protein